MARRPGARRVGGSRINRIKTQVCAKCYGYIRPDDVQCASCGWLEFITFDSQAEAGRFGELRLLLNAGKIKDLELQPKFELLTINADNIKMKVGEYWGDFRYVDIERDNMLIVEDVKGGDARSHIETDLFAWKKRHMKAQYDIYIQIIKR